MKQPQLEKLFLHNYKNLVFPSEGLELNSLSVLIGANGCGKSNLINALKFIKDAVTETADSTSSALDAALLTLGYERILNLKHVPPQTIQVDLYFSAHETIPTGAHLDLDLFIKGATNKILLDKDKLTALVSASNQKNNFIYYEFHSKRNGEGVVSVYNQGDSKGSHFEPIVDIPANELALTCIPRLLENSEFTPEQTPIYKLRRQLLEYIGKWRFYNANNMNLEKIRNSTPKVGGSDKLLSNSGENLALVTYNLMNQYIDFEEQVNNAMRLVFPDNRRLRAISQGQFLTLTGHFDRVSSTEPLYLNELSDGSVRMLCWAVLLHAPELPSLLVIDEPELGLHPAWLKILAQWIIQASECTQIIITTHSSDLLDHFSDHIENVIVFNPTPEGYCPTHLQREKLDFLLQEEWELGDMYRVGEPSVGGWPW